MRDRLIAALDWAAIVAYNAVTPRRLRPGPRRPTRVEHDEWAAAFERVGWTRPPR